MGASVREETGDTVVYQFLCTIVSPPLGFLPEPLQAPTGYVFLGRPPVLLYLLLKGSSLGHLSLPRSTSLQ